MNSNKIDFKKVLIRKNQNLPVAIIGGGPIGLAAAAHLKRNNQKFILFESGNEIGWNILKWGHVNLFSPWEYNIDKVAEELLQEAKIRMPNKELIPNGNEIVNEYLKPLSELEGIKNNIHLNSKVIAIGRKGLDKTKTSGRENLPFSIQVNENGNHKIVLAKAVIDASGTWHNPNPAGSGGISAIGEIENKDHIHYGMPDITGNKLKKIANKNVLVIGGGHSAIGTILALNSILKDYPKTRIHWVLRKKNIEDVYGGKDADEFKSCGALGIKIERLVNSDVIKIHSPVYIHEIEKTKAALNIVGVKNETAYLIEGIDEIICCTGSRPDFSFLREVRFDSDSFLECVPALTDLIDPNIHSCGTVRPHGEFELRQKEENFYIVGMKSYGRAPTFLMATGYEQVRSIVAYMSGNFESAKNVELHLPETGVCSSGIGHARSSKLFENKRSCDTDCTSSV